MKRKPILKRIQPWPWFVKFRQYSQDGKSSRPQLLDAGAVPVRMGRADHATLAAMSPVLLDRLRALAERCEILHLQVQSSLALNIEPPAELTQAFELLRIAERL